MGKRQVCGLTAICLTIVATGGCVTLRGNSKKLKSTQPDVNFYAPTTWTPIQEQGTVGEGPNNVGTGGPAPNGTPAQLKRVVGSSVLKQAPELTQAPTGQSKEPISVMGVPKNHPQGSPTASARDQKTTFVVPARSAEPQGRSGSQISLLKGAVEPQKRSGGQISLLKGTVKLQQRDPRSLLHKTTPQVQIRSSEPRSILPGHVPVQSTQPMARIVRPAPTEPAPALPKPQAEPVLSISAPPTVTKKAEPLPAPPPVPGASMPQEKRGPVSPVYRDPPLKFKNMNSLPKWDGPGPRKKPQLGPRTATDIPVPPPPGAASYED